MLSIQSGHTVLLSEGLFNTTYYLSVESGLLRVAISNPEHEALQTNLITLGFLQAGDHLSLDLFRNSRLHLQAINSTRLVEATSGLAPAGSNSLNDWTLNLLLVRHIGEAEQRIQALIQLLVERLGRRSGKWYELPFRLTHAELAELSGHTRVTVTKQFSRWRKQGLVEQAAGPNRLLRVSPQLLAA
ncbi:Crp/Fnr family transcriptional regulator [Cyanobium sp. WAJ14-Wanaka]|uniref:Crp/Fnr family transcriptional regulator n=1 Tax=Cyanobium sp. WAJ14-Wanaka TaxID=2823725 RepID=UPI0020CE0E2D|nr:Crp/Fnr family transcriptional regulator [Cyanobium sp. WAJ14-Wanaka]MCP9775506.1 Crp/Fnr family transcriptional regulator [Cyanobium sp. WAJ14-Wanaka]